MLCIQKNRILIKHYQLIITLESTIFECKMNQQIIEFMEVENAGVLAYTRCLDKQKLLVCCNFRDVESQMEFTQEWKSGRKILGNYEENHKNNYKVLTLRPYEIIVLEKGEE